MNIKTNLYNKKTNKTLIKEAFMGPDFPIREVARLQKAQADTSYTKDGIAVQKGKEIGG